MLPGIEYIKTLLNGIMSRLRRVEKKAVNSDWNVHDPGDGAHVKNRPFYNDYVESMFLYRVNDPPTNGQGAAYLGIFESAFIVGKTYRVTLYGAGVNNGTYECKCIIGDGNNGTTVGRLYLLKSVGSHAINDGSIFQNPDTLEVFAWSWWDDAKYTLTIEGPGYELKRIDKKFLPDFVTSFNGKTGDVSHLPIVSRGFTDPTVPSNTAKRDLLALGSTAVMLNDGNKGIYVNERNDLCLLVGDNRRAYVVRGGVSYPIIDLESQDATLRNYIRRPNTASVGQAITVKAVDENGKPTEWETSDMVTVDSTLTKSGQAADAAAVGNRLSALSEEIVTTAESKVSEHNTGTDTHSDIRMMISGLTDRLNALADSDDTTLDQLSEVVAYIKSNRTLIEAITTSKVNVSDIIDNLTTNVTNKPLSAAQGVALKALIDGIVIPDKLPNPNAITFTGAVTGSYDGSAPLSVEIPSGGGAGIVIDSTLTKSGQAADASAVGNRLSALSEEIANLQTSGLTTAQVNALDGMFKAAAYDDSKDVSGAYAAFKAAFGLVDSGDTGGGGEEPPVVTTYTITAELVNVTSNNSATSVTEGTSYTATLTAADGYALDTVTVTMGGVDVTADVYANGVISIASVTGNVEIVASAMSSGTETAELNTNGLLGYFDFRNRAASSGNGSTGYYESATVGDGRLYAWHSKSAGNEYGKYANSMQFCSGSSYTVHDFGTKFTWILKAYCDSLYTLPGAKDYMTPNNVGVTLAPKYNTSDSTATATSKTIKKVPVGYHTVIMKASDSVLQVYVDAALAAEYNGADIDGFVSWYGKFTANEMWATSPTVMVHTAMAFYGRALTDVEIVEMDEYLKTLEVNA